MSFERLTLAWDGCVNVRDVGGLPTEDGAEIATRVLVRADSVGRLTEAGWSALDAYGVRRIIDLRFDAELAADPPRRLPVDVVHVPLLPDPSEPDWVEIEAVAAREADALSAKTSMYLEVLRRYGAAFASAVRAFADAPDGPVVVHCLSGKDRTGLVVALLLRLAGVAPGEIAADYALSEVNLAETHARWIAAADGDAERARRERAAASPASVMRAVLDELAARHGDARAYLVGAGLEEAEAATAARRLRG